MKKVRVGAVEDLSEGCAVKFEFERDGRMCEGFAAQFKGQFVAYENLCRHIAISLDYGDNRFFARDGCHFVCQTHGALYEPLSGLCVRGPCEGDRLKRLELEVVDGVIWSICR